MKICIDLTSLDDNFSGIERYAACLSVEMIKDDRIDFVLLFKNKVHPMFETAKNYKNVEIIVIPGCQKLLFNQIRLPHIIYKVNADWYLFLAFPVPLILFKKNMVSTIHDICCWDCPETMNGMSKWYFRISHKVALKKCKAIITISVFSKNRIVEKLKYPAEKIWLIYCGIDDKFKPITDEASIDYTKKKYLLPDEYILSLSTLEPRKNIRLLIDAYRDLVLSGDCKTDLVLAGRKGWKMDELMSGIEPEVQNKIIFTGFVDDDDLPCIYSEAKLFVFPSKYEGFGIPPLEAMACGALVISSDAASLLEVIGDAGLVFQSNNKETLKQSILQVQKLSKEDLKAQVVAGKTAARKFRWKKEAKKLLELLRCK